jgi:hypothetical protein
MNLNARVTRQQEMADSHLDRDSLQICDRGQAEDDLLHTDRLQGRTERTRFVGNNHINFQSTGLGRSCLRRPAGDRAEKRDSNHVE